MPGEVLKLSIQEALITMFTDDPINWLKWAVVFAVLIGGYAIAVPLYKKASHGMSWERKRDIAKSRDHVIKRILELDSKIERSIDGRAAISVPIKQGFVAEKINELISKIDQIIESE